MAFTRTRTINGKQYTYEEHRWREGGKVRSKSVYLGPGVKPRAIFTPIRDEERGLRYIERQMAKYPGDPFATKEAERQAATNTVGKELGVTLSQEGEEVTPIEKSTTEAPSREASQAEANPAEGKN